LAQGKMGKKQGKKNKKGNPLNKSSCRSSSNVRDKFFRGEKFKKELKLSGEGSALRWGKNMFFRIARRGKGSEEKGEYAL